MALNRREFSRCLLGTTLGTVVATPALAQTAPVEGVHYVRLAKPVPLIAPGKIEVIEFFWYECPHCNAFEPALDAWAKKQAGDVALQRVPIWFRDEPFTTQQRLFYALESLGVLGTMHRKVFAAIHNDHLRLRTAEDLTAFALNNGVDPLRFVAAYNSPAVQAKVQQARRIAAAYQVDAVPAMGVQGRYLTTGSLANAGSSAGSNDRMLDVVDVLVARVRQGERG